MAIMFQVAVLAVLPPIILGLSRRNSSSRRNIEMIGCIGLAALFLGAAIFVGFGLYALGGSTVNEDTYGSRIVWLSINPLQNALFIVLIAAIVVLARRYDGTLPLWMVTVGAGYFALWFGLGALPPSGNAWPMILLTTLAGVFAAILACVVAARRNRTFNVPFGLSWRSLVAWAALTGASTFIGVLVAWSLVSSGAFRFAWVTPGQPDLAGTVKWLAFVLVLGLVLYTWATYLARPPHPPGTHPDQGPHPLRRP